MFYSNARKKISTILVIAIFAMIISPLCHLKGAQASFIEICTAAGIQRISIEPAQSAENFDQAAQSEALSGSADQTTIIQSKCPICLLSGKKLILPQSVQFTAVFDTNNSDLAPITYDVFYTDNHSDIFSARAPPLTLQA